MEKKLFDELVAGIVETGAAVRGEVPPNHTAEEIRQRADEIRARRRCTNPETTRRPQPPTSRKAA